MKKVDRYDVCKYAGFRLLTNTAKKEKSFPTVNDINSVAVNTRTIQCLIKNFYFI